MSYQFKDESASQKTDTINYRSYVRNVPSQPLQPYLDFRSVSTKYSRMPIIDPRKHSNVPLTQMGTYNIEKVFNPGNDKAPFSGYNPNQESILRNQIFALQDCSQAAYVPSSNSDLYQVHWKQNDLLQPFPDLFQKQVFPIKGYQHSEHVGYALFNNATRQQHKDLNC